MKGAFSGARALSLGGLVALLCACGCGGGESHLTRAQFARQANAICRQAAADQAKLAGRYEKSQIAPGQYGPVTEVFVPPMAKELRRLRALDSPPADEARIRAILRAIESGVKDAKFDYLDLFVKETDPFAQANKLARKYGLEACAESSHAVIKPQG
jgi:hypothetical protein